MEEGLGMRAAGNGISLIIGSRSLLVDGKGMNGEEKETKVSRCGFFH